MFDLSTRSLERIVEDENVNVMFVSANVTRGNRLHSVKCKIVGTIHGLRAFETPWDSDFFNYRATPIVRLKEIMKHVFSRWYKKRIKKIIMRLLSNPNVKIVTVSNHSASSFKCFFPEIPNLSIPVFYSPSTSVINTTNRKYHEKYFLMVSANRSYKNNLRAIRALDNLFSYGYASDIQVKVTGVIGPESFHYKIRNKDKFEFVGFVDERELDQLYHDAYCFIYPSLNEGFGYPPLEAMHYGIPILSSPFSSIPEVCGGNVLYFNPFSVEEIMNRILQILDGNVHAMYSRLAKERYEIITKRQNEDLDKLIDYIYDI